MSGASSIGAANRKLGAGGEAEVYEVEGRPKLAFKKYRVPSPARAAKLRVMLASPPDGVAAGAGGRGSDSHVAIAWPTELVIGAGGVVEGFLMPRIDLTATVPLFQVYNPASRAQIAPAFTWRYLLRTARNVAAIVDSLHRAGYVVGDINESNLLVNKRALAVLVDCDSMQVRDAAGGEVHRGGVGKPEFTAPELQGVDLSSVDRTVASDDFALAVLVFQLLLEGVHPFAGVWRGSGEPPDIPSRMRDGLFPYRRGARVAPPPHAMSLDVLPPALRRLAWRCFTTGVRRPAARPTAAEWMPALEAADLALTTCDRSVHHVFGSHLRRCPWCERLDLGLPDPFPGPTGVSTLARRPPPWSARARAASATFVRRIAVTVATMLWQALRDGTSAVGRGVASLGRRLGRALGAAGSAVARRVWRTIGPPLVGPVPIALAAAALAATAPVLAGAVLLAAALAFWAGIRTSPVHIPAQNGKGRGWVGVRWALVVASLALLATHGPWWWPLS